MTNKNKLYEDFARDVDGFSNGHDMGYGALEVADSLFWRREQMGSEVPKNIAKETLRLGKVRSEYSGRSLDKI